MVQRSLVASSVLVYLASFAAPYKGEPGGGLLIFLFGGLFCWALPVSLPWWANVLYWLALRAAYRGRWGRAAALAVPTPGLATGWLLCGFYGKIAAGAPAFWMWVGSFGLMAAAALTGRLVTAIDAVDPAADGEATVD